MKDPKLIKERTREGYNIFLAYDFPTYEAANAFIIKADGEYQAEILTGINYFKMFDGKFRVICVFNHMVFFGGLHEFAMLQGAVQPSFKGKDVIAESLNNSSDKFLGNAAFAIRKYD